jgi:4'-phosphopantetheinyl transferase
VADARLQRLLPEAPIELWLADLSVEPGQTAIDALSPAERARAARFMLPRDRRRYLAAHCALRHLLSDRIKVPAGMIEFRFGPHGKPALAGAHDCRFNLSDSEEVALIGLSERHEIGVDVEKLRSVPDATALAERNYTEAEQRELAAEDGGNRDLAFLYGWTRKEACLKAIGSGLSIAPSTFDAGLAPRPRTVRIPTPSGTASVRLASFRFGSGVVASYAYLP